MYNLNYRRTIMAKFKIRPYDDYKAWDTAETIEEARAKRSKLAMSFFSREVVIVDENENEVDNDIDYEDIYDNIDDYEYPYNHVNRCDL